MKNGLNRIGLTACAVCLLAGCATQKRIYGEIVEVTPSPCVLTPDSAGRAVLDVTFRFSGDCFSRRSRLFLFPTLLCRDSAAAVYAPVVLDAPVYAKKNDRRRVLDGYTDPYAATAERTKQIRNTSVEYHADILLPESGDCRLTALVSTVGCGSCSGQDTIEIAAISDPLSLPDGLAESMKTMEAPARTAPKTRHGRGMARLWFAMNASDIQPDRGSNSEEMARMLTALRAVAGDSLAQLDSVTITGLASADGPLPYNTALARRRAESALGWLLRQPGMPACGHFAVDSRPEGWEPVLAAMTAAGDPDSLAVKAVLTQYEGVDDDVQEQHIRRLACWPEIRGRYLQNERKVEYTYTYTIRNFTDDDELLRLYALRSDAFSEAEFLHAAALTNDPSAKRQVYETLLVHYPASQAGANNLAVLYAREGRDDEASALFLQSGTPEARYNLGLLRLRQRRPAEAYRLLLPSGGRHAAIAALSLGLDEEAARILARSDDDSPAAAYVGAHVAARQDDDTRFFRSLASASRDEKLRLRAISEPGFAVYRSDTRFAAAIHGKEKRP